MREEKRQETGWSKLKRIYIRLKRISKSRNITSPLFFASKLQRMH